MKSVLIDKQKEILLLIKGDTPRERHFFRTATKSGKPSAWLEILKKEEYFNPSNLLSEPAVPCDVQDDPRWYVLDYLEAVASENEAEPKEKITKLLEEIIEDNCNAIRQQRPEEINSVAQWMLFKVIGKLPSDRITPGQADNIILLSSYGNTLIFSELAKSVASKLLRVGDSEVTSKLFGLIILEECRGTPLCTEYGSKLSEHWLKTLLDNNLTLLSKSIPYECFKILIEHINTLQNKASRIFNVVCIPDIEGEKKNSSEIDYQVQLIRIVRGLLDRLTDEEIRKAIDLLEEKETPIIRRILFYIFATRFHSEGLKESIWEKVRLSDSLEFSEGKREVYRFFEENAKRFSPSQIKTIVEWIEEKDYPYFQGESDRDELEAYERKEWLMSLLSSKDESVLERYKHYNLINPSEIKHPGYKVWIGSAHRVVDISPYEIEDLKESSVENLVSTINAYKGGEISLTNGPSKRGLARDLESLMQDNPEKYTNIGSIRLLLGLPPYYLYHLFVALNRVPNEKIAFSLRDFLELMLQHVQKDNFPWDSRETNLYLREFFLFLTSQINDNSPRIELPLVSIMDEILLYSLKHYASAKDFDTDDVVNLSINTLPGSLFEATVTYLLWVARITMNDEKIRWEKEFKDIFTEKLSCSERGKDREFSATLGRFFHNMLYLDSEWVWKNFDKIFPKDNENVWKDTMSAFLFYTNDVYDRLYIELKESEHYSKALKTKFHSEGVKSMAIAHICVAYLFEIEGYGDSLLRTEIIDGNNVSLVRQVIWHFSRREDIEGDEGKEARLKYLWSQIFDKFKDLEDDESEKVIFSLAGLQKHFSSLKPNFEMLKLSFRYSSSADHPFESFKMLQKYVNKEAGLVGKLILSSIEGGYYALYEEDILKPIVRKMYEVDEKDKANKICNAYLHKGINYLREILEEHNQ